MLDQQACRLQRLLRLAAEPAACSFRRSACVRRATPSGRSFSSSSARGASRSSRAHSAASRRAPSSAERAATLRRDSSSALAELLVARRAILQAVRAARGKQVGEHGELVVLHQIRRVDLDRERALGRLLRAAVAAAEILGQRVAQRRLRGAVASRDAPFARPPRQARQARRCPGSARRAESRCRPAAAGTGSATGRAATRPNRTSPARRWCRASSPRPPPRRTAGRTR